MPYPKISFNLVKRGRGERVLKYPKECSEDGYFIKSKVICFIKYSMISIIYGTRPEFLKLKCLIDLFRKNFIPFQVIKVEQHINLIEDKGYYDEILTIDNICEDRISNIGSSILSKLPKLIKSSSHVLAQGDTATVFFSLLCSFQNNKKNIHLEAGMRTYDLNNPFPEEGYRQMISRITDIHLCPSEIEKKILKDEKVKGQIYVVGNSILDLVKSYKIPIVLENKVIITLHRRENWHSFKNYIIELIYLIKNNSNFTFIFLIHPNPNFKNIINELKEIIPDNLIIQESVTHVELIKLLSKCAFAITDSGGIQEEANFLGKHIFLLRKNSERQSIDESKISLCDINNIKNIECKYYYHKQGLEYGEGNTCDKIINILKQLID